MIRKTEFYFAFGSNIHAGQMALRCPDAEFIGVYALPEWRFTFSQLHRGANIFYSAVGADIVWGAVYRISESDEAALDEYEGVALQRYQKIYIRHIDFSSELLVYNVPKCCGAVQPYQDYHERILDAMRAREFPADYIEYVRAIGNLGVDHPERNYRGNSDGLR
ncbi:MAG: hypothetical protein CL561_06290 [Alphaproteobacteria bacterium]|nr:hypothetical protein [Alphaproteobacteria bacterium]|tara:strand:- start:437311 stop:437802 length:492 start_codon:yes stop_codon:yes gene_type:complete